MIAPRHQRFTVRDALAVPWRHKGKATLFFLAVMGAAAAVTFLSPKTYRSEGKLLVRLGRENMALDPTATLGATPLVGVQQSREMELNSDIDILKSRVLIEKVVDAIGPPKILDREEALSETSKPEDVSPEEATADAREQAIRVATRSLNVESVRKSAVIQISYDAPSPKLAQEFVAKLTDYFLDEHIRLSRTPGAHEFMSSQKTASHNRLKEKEEQLRALKDETGLAAPDSQRTILVSRIGKLQDEMLMIDASLASAEAEVQKLRGQLRTLPVREVTEETEGFANEAADGMRQQLYTLEVREKDLAARFTDDHPQLQQVRDQIAKAKSVFSEEEPKRTQTKTAQSKPHEEVKLLLLKQEPVLAALRAKGDRVRSQLAAEQESLKKLNEGELRVARLQRETFIEEANYKRYVDSLEQVSIDGAMAADGKSNINIVQPATFDRKPIKPRPMMNLALAFVVASLGAVGLSFIAEAGNRTIRTPAELEQRLELPVLAAIPRLRAVQLAPTELEEVRR
jgi:polysaccharide biosynthesis protein PslE